jgi:transitional endoplasmic reticulum ATPase
MKFSRLYGFDETTLRRVREGIIEPLQEHRYNDLAPGYLFFGPPGVGKTAMIEAIATEARGKMRFIRQNVISIMMASSSQERFKESIDKTFERARKNAPAFIYFDKPERIESPGMMEEMPVHSIAQSYIGEKLREIRGDRISLLLEVQDPYELDSSLFGAGRIEDMFHFDYPDEERLRTIITRLMPRRLRIGELDQAMTSLRGLSPAMVGTVIGRAANHAAGQERPITIDDLELIRQTTSFYMNDRQAGNAARFWRGYGAITSQDRMTWDSVVGLEGVKQQFTRIERILKDKKFSGKFGLELPKGLLLYGPPGCGKTMITRIMGSRLGVHFIHQSASELHSTYWGEAKNKVKGLFSEAERKSPALIFLDDIDTLKSRHIPGEAGAALSEIITQILYELDSVRIRKNILFIGATNLPWEMDEALMRPGRIDKKIYVPPPNAPARVQLFQMYLAGRPIRKLDLNTLTRMTENFSGADIREICSTASEQVADIYLQDGKFERISMQRMENIIRNYRPSIPPSLLRAYTQYSNRASGPDGYIG